MDKKNYYVFGILLLLTILSESRVIVPRAIQNLANSGNGEIPYTFPLGSADKPGISPEISNKPSAGGEFGLYDYDVRPFDYDYEIPGEVPKKEADGGTKVNPEKFPSDTDRTEGPLTDNNEKGDGLSTKNPDTDKLGDDDSYVPFDDDSKIPVDKGDSKPVDEEGKSIPNDKDESDIDNNTDEKDVEDDSVKGEHDENEEDKNGTEDKRDRLPEGKDGPKGDDEESKEHDEDDNGEKSQHGEEEDGKSEEHDESDDGKSEEHDESDDGKSEEHDEKDDGKSEEHDEHDDEKPEEHDEHNDEKPEEHDENDDEKPEDDDTDIHATEDAEPISGGSIFDTPFFNYERVKNYFGLLDKALGHAFRETMEEAKLLNGTYANTTEEEVDIDGKKYVVQKSLIKSADNHSTIYVETLSTKPKVNDTEEMKNTELRNTTNV